jgi:hypothetical protein
MRRYSNDEEERVRVQELVREWVRSGLIEAARGEALAMELRVDLKRTNPFLRGGLALFTGLIVAALVGLVAVSLDLRDKGAIAVLTGLSALACIGAADVLAGTYRCYRFGVEEALAVASVVLLCIAGAALSPSGWSEIVALGLGAAGGLALYRRFGFVYAALAAAVCVAAIPFQYDLPAALQRLAAAAVAGSIFIAARPRRLALGDDYPGDEYGHLQAAALAGVYTAVNVHLSEGMYALSGWFYWFTYLATWILPIAGLRTGLRDRDRDLIDVSLVLTLITLLTNKAYLGWTRNTWDPILLGVLLIGVAIAVRRWLEHGPGRERYGFTAQRILDKDRTARSMLSMVSAALPAPGGATTHAEPAPPEFGGGRSGGAGGGGTY